MTRKLSGTRQYNNQGYAIIIVIAGGILKVGVCACNFQMKGKYEQFCKIQSGGFRDLIAKTENIVLTARQGVSLSFCNLDVNVRPIS